MNWEQIEGRWDQVKGKLRTKWAKLTDDDLEYMRGNRDRVLGKLKERYGLAREEAERSLDELLRS
jgi:uncharacterized protein YjbJ (UPF0337 family)